MHLQPTRTDGNVPPLAYAPLFDGDEPQSARTLKTCQVCRERKTLDQFYWSFHGNRNKGRRTPDYCCKECKKTNNQEWMRRTPEKQKAYRAKAAPKTRLYAVRRKYGLSPADYEELIAQHESCCAICRRKGTKARPLHVDHCHKAGRVRGLLCWHCNVGIGHFGDNPVLLRAAIEYLSRREPEVGFTAES